MKKKIQLQDEVFEGISSVFAVKGGFDFTIPTSGSGAGKASASINSNDSNLFEFPVSDESGFNFDTGAPTVDNFKIKGLGAAWVSTFTPGDGSITLEIPCNETNIMEACFGSTPVEATIELKSGILGNNAVSFKGAAFAAPQKAVYFGMLILNDAEDKLLFIKKAKFMAQAIFDGSNKPLCVVLTGNLSAAADPTSFGVLTKVVTA